ncbi:MAG: hypothetical protein LBE31_03310, partial [Deltaproteobacteria bacterium]|nr:hypothetical protein [Deltaproteobacteria bacterium]
MAARSSPSPAPFSIRCPACGKKVVTPASVCPHCRVILSQATEPKEKPPIIKRLANLIIILACLAIVIYFVNRLRQTGDVQNLNNK